MADVIIRDDQSLDIVAPEKKLPAAESRNSATSRFGTSRSTAAIIGTGIVTLLIAYLFWGSVRIEAGTRSGVRYRAETIWADYASYLVRQGASPELILVVSGFAVLSVVGSCLLIGLAFAIRNEYPDEQ